MVRSEVEAKKFMADLDAQAKLTQAFSFTGRVTAKAASTTIMTIPIPDGADFQQLGYNIEYQEAADKKEYLRLKFSQKVGNRTWSNDFEPIKSIATPGVRSATPIPRYGFRVFPLRIKAKDQITIQVENAAAEDLQVCITLIGNLWFL